MTKSEQILGMLVQAIEKPPYHCLVTLDDSIGNIYVHFCIDGVEHFNPLLQCLSVLSGSLTSFFIEYYDKEKAEYCEIFIQREEYLNILLSGFAVESH